MKKRHIVCLIEPLTVAGPSGSERIGTGTPFVHCGIVSSSDEASMAKLLRLSDGKEFSVPHRLTSSYPRLISITKAHGHYQVHHPFFVVFDDIAPSFGHIRVSESPDLNPVVEIPDSIPFELIRRHPLEELVAV